MPVSSDYRDWVLEQLRRAGQGSEIEWFTIPGDAPFVGQSIVQAGIRQRTGASIVTVLRGETVYSNPGPELILAAGDIVAVLGTRVQRDAFRALLVHDPALAARQEAPLEAAAEQRHA